MPKDKTMFFSEEKTMLLAKTEDQQNATVDQSTSNDFSAESPPGHNNNAAQLHFKSGSRTLIAAQVQERVVSLFCKGEEKWDSVSFEAEKSTTV